MTRAIREHVTVEQEGVIEIRHPGLSVGMTAEVVVLVRQPAGQDRPLVSFIGKGKGCFASASDVDAFLQSEREAWD
ncbi:MAG TPA: hypothetical protein VGX68_13445 [Thermoanaerobaculia bacterium]|jgi:hypothetical protein|nr:hypothetical protein [Thermoanaerobaculia bacterium]